VNLALEHFADNPIIDELVTWPPRRLRVRCIRACNVLFRKPFIEVELEDGSQFHRHFQREAFASHWAAAVVILRAMTAIELKADFRFTPYADVEALTREALAARDECLAEAEQMYREGMFEQFLMQFGPDCAHLPAAVEQMLAEARRRVGADD